MASGGTLQLAGARDVPSLAEGAAALAPGTSRDRFLDIAEVLVCIALLSLFLPLKVQLGVVQVRPFDFLSVVLFALVLMRLRRLPRPNTWIGFVILIPYLLWHVVSAFLPDALNGAREALQMIIVSLFAFSTYALLPVIRYRRLVPILFLGMTAITAYNIYWHVSRGMWFGWKHLGSWSTSDIKYTFEFLPPIIGLLILFGRGRLAYVYWALWIAFGVIIVFSGERKALLAYGLLTAALLTRARAHFAIPVLVATYFGVTWISSQLDRGYLSQQLSSIANYTPGQASSFDMIVRGAGPASQSDAQRIFAFHVGGELLKDKWLTGVGTNAYQDYVWRNYSYAPPTLLLGIHGEFWRVLVENGILGLILYTAIWVAAAWRLVKELTWLAGWRAITPYAGRLLFLILMIPAGFSIAFEAPGTHAFIALFLISFSPELVRYGLREHLRLAIDAQKAVEVQLPPRMRSTQLRSEARSS